MTMRQIHQLIDDCQEDHDTAQTAVGGRNRP